VSLEGNARPATSPTEPAQGPGRGATDRRELVGAALGCLLAAATVLISVGRPWIRFVVATATGLDVRSTVTGHHVAAAATAFGLVVLAGVVALPATRRNGRIGAGALITLAGLGIAVAAQAAALRPRAAVATHANQVAGLSGAAPRDVAVTPWPWLTLVGGLLAVGVGLLTVVRSRRWPAMGRGYESGRNPSPGASTESSMWDLLDDGHDPTV
jgi:uncharacterized membrane protein (TIGR02234 family)